MRIAEFSESSNLRTQMALSLIGEYVLFSVAWLQLGQRAFCVLTCDLIYTNYEPPVSIFRVVGAGSSVCVCLCHSLWAQSVMVCAGN